MIIFAGANKMIFNQKPNLKMEPLKQKVEDYLPDNQVVRILLNAWNWIKTNIVLIFIQGKG